MMNSTRLWKQLRSPVLARCLATTTSRAAAVLPAEQQPGNHHTDSKFLLLAAAIGAAGSVALAWNEPSKAPRKDPQATRMPLDVYKGSSSPPAPQSVPNLPPPRPDLPTIPLEEVAEHASEDSMWFTFRGAVYDMTAFQNGHPGGAPRLQMAAGQDLEPYWHVYRQHFRGHVIQWMEKYRIGNLSPQDAAAAKKPVFGDMFTNDPVRHPDLLPATSKPFNGEPRIELLTQDFFTPNELFYVRCHLAVPDIDPAEYRLIVSGKGIDKHKFTLNDLQTKFPKHEVITTLQCAGNRREDLHDKDHQIFISPHWYVCACRVHNERVEWLCGFVLFCFLC